MLKGSVKTTTNYYFNATGKKVEKNDMERIYWRLNRQYTRVDICAVVAVNVLSTRITDRRMQTKG